MLQYHVTTLLVVCFVFPFASSAFAQIDFEREPINYNVAKSNDPIARLQRQIDTGEVELKFDSKHGYLIAVLEQLGMPRSSQALVFSKTSMQRSRISPRTPRALYFNDDCYIGWCYDGEVLEAAAMDSQLGAVFYTLSQSPINDEKPRFIRDQGHCNTCHASSRTKGVPGLVIRSLFSDAGGSPRYGAGTFTTDHASPMDERWGGWYVTGRHGAMRHMGNAFSSDREHPDQIDREAGANRMALIEPAAVDRYLEPTSDIVALMVLEHQTQMHNYITLANYESRHAKHHDAVMNKVLERPVSYRSETTERRLHRAAEKLVTYMLMADEFRLESAIEGNETYQRVFTAMGPFDSQGRSLRQFDLKKRLFKYPCSYLIYSESFEKLPEEVKAEIFAQLDDALTCQESPHGLTPENQIAIREILAETQDGFASYLKNPSLPGIEDDNDD